MDLHTKEGGERGKRGDTRSLVVRVKENSTRLAELGTKSLRLQTAFPAETRSVGTQTSIFTTDMCAAQQWRSIQGAYQVELQRLQNRINLIITQISKQEQVATESLSTTAAQKLQLALHRQARPKKSAKEEKTSVSSFTRKDVKEKADLALGL